jgi:hypothetical protein
LDSVDSDCAKSPSNCGKKDVCYNTGTSGKLVRLSNYLQEKKSDAWAFTEILFIALTGLALTGLSTLELGKEEKSNTLYTCRGT